MVKAPFVDFYGQIENSIRFVEELRKGFVEGGVFGLC